MSENEINVYWLQGVMVDLIKFVINDGLMHRAEKLDYIHNLISEHYTIAEKIEAHKTETENKNE